MMVEENAVQTVKIADAMKITDLESLKVLADPLRLSILEYLMKPSTVKRIAEKLGKPPTKLYYHFNLLEQHGLIQLVDTRVVSGIIEKHYQATARSYQVDKGLLAPGSVEGDSGVEMTISGILADTKNDFLESRSQGAFDVSKDAPPHRRMIMGQLRLNLTPDQIASMHERLDALLDELDVWSQANENNPDAMPFKMLIFAHPSSRILHDEAVTEDTSVSAKA
jgi:DNA-binding transcriptional ArsR family regulator